MEWASRARTDSTREHPPQEQLPGEGIVRPHVAVFHNYPIKKGKDWDEA